MQLAPQADRQWWLTLRHSPIAMALVAPDGTFLAVNDAFHSMLGYDSQSVGSLTFHEITHPEDLAATSGWSGAVRPGHGRRTG